MNGSRPPRPMTHSTAYQEHQRSSNSSSPAHYHPRTPPLQRPPAAFFNQARPGPAGRYHSENAHVKTSVSSATSASSAASELKAYQHMQPYIMGPQAEGGHVQQSSRRASHMSPTPSHLAVGSNAGQTEMVEDHSAVIRYIQEHEIDEERQPEKDHAIWILVSLHSSSTDISRANVPTVLAVLSGSTALPLQLFLHYLRTARPGHAHTIPSLPQRIVVQYLANTDCCSRISKSSSDDMRPISQERPYLRLQSCGSCLRSHLVTNTELRSSLLLLDSCRVLALRHHHGQSRRHRKAR